MTWGQHPLYAIPRDSTIVVTLSGHNICLNAHIVISKTIFYQNRSEFKCSMCLRNFENLNIKWNCVSIQQAIITLINLFEHKMDIISYKSCTLPNDMCIGNGLYLV